MNTPGWGELASLRLGLDDPVPFRAQHGEDVFAWRFFEAKRDGYFVEVGAHDGTTFSNTYALERLGWRGMLIEANPYVIDRCRASRPGSITVHAAVGGADASGVTRFCVATGEGLSLLSSMSPDENHVRRIQKEGGAVEDVEVPFRSLSSILDDGREIDFMTVDIEGGELEALQGMDLTRRGPPLLMVENNFLGADTRVREYVEARGYTMVDVLGCNEVFVRDSQKGRGTQE